MRFIESSILVFMFASAIYAFWQHDIQMSVICFTMFFVSKMAVKVLN